jgi:hypothetical protein
MSCSGALFFTNALMDTSNRNAEHSCDTRPSIISSLQMVLGLDPMRTRRVSTRSDGVH